MEAPRDLKARRDLVFEPRFHDTDALIGSLEQGVIDHAAVSGIAAAIQHAIQASPSIENYVVALWNALIHPDEAGIHLDGVDTAALIKGGASPRGLAFLVRSARVRAWLDGRDWLVPEDIRDVFPEVMGHRVFLEPVYELRRETIVPDLIRAVFEKVPAP